MYPVTCTKINDVHVLLFQNLTAEPGVSLPSLFVQLYPKDSFTPDFSFLQTLSAIYFVIAYSPFVNYLTTAVVAEKEKKIREAMRMMGLRDSAFW